MEIIWGVVLIALSLLAWGGQALSWLAPRRAERLTLIEREDTVEPAYYADIRAEALWDTMTLWVLLVAGILLIGDVDAWAYFGLLGSGIYLYFAGRGITTRLSMQRRGLRIGAAQNTSAGYAFLSVCGIVALLTIPAAAIALSS